MRDIKFRAWNARTGMTFFDIGELLPEPLPNYYISQYTGLKDKNGVEIYEGDIVNFLENFGYAGWHQSNNPGVVEFNKGQYLVTGSQMSLAGDISHHGIEVIGNIYENPELLK